MPSLINKRRDQFEKLRRAAEFLNNDMHRSRAWAVFRMDNQLSDSVMRVVVGLIEMQHGKVENKTPEVLDP